MLWRVPARDGLDAALAVGVLALSEIEVATGRVAGPLWVGALSGLLLGVPLAWRGRFPTTVLVVVFTTFLAANLLGLNQFNYLAEVVAGLVSLYTFAARVPLLRAVAGFVYAYVLTAVAALTGGLEGYGWGFILLGGAWLAGRAMRSRRRLIAQLQATADELQRSRDENTRAAIADERARIARELHDVVAHAVSVIVVQAGAAERVLDHDAPRAQAALASIQDTGRQALAELRRLLGVLRPDDAGPAILEPQPGLADLEALVRSLSDAGLAVSLRREGACRELSPGVDLAAYRIVQEALTNVIKHAGARSAAVAVRYRPDAVELEIVDDGRGATASRNGNRGHGLLGMRERAAVYGGELEAGPARDGGYAVRARLPVAVAR